ncbi:MAG: PduL/EutD family phosphate acyltransferase, partial [Anaerovorax sp.]
MGYKVEVGLSNKHLHLKTEDIEILFGKGHELTPTKPLKQPGQFACEEKVDIVGPKSTLKGIRVLGPARPETQIELAMTDARTIGISAPVRESGKLEGPPGCKLVGPKGEIELDHGVIVALRHIHLTPAQAVEAGVKDK